MSWRRFRLDWLATEERHPVNPAEMSADLVYHYSIPALDEFGDGCLEAPSEIGSGKLLLSGGEVLISKLNPRLPRVLLAEAHDVPTLASTEFIALRPGPNVDERFLRYWFGSEQLRQMLNGATMSVTRSQQRVRPEILTKSWLRLPSINEQRAIADYLDRETAQIDGLIEKKQRVAELCEEHFWSEVDHLTTPDGCETVALRHYVEDACDGPFGSALKSEHYSEAGARVVRLGNIGRASWNDGDVARIPLPYWNTLSRHHAGKSDVVVAGLGDDGHPVGRACVLPDLGPTLVKADCYRLRLRTEVVDSKYLAFYLCSPKGLGTAAMLADGATRPRLTLGKAMSLAVPLLPIDQQRLVASSLAHRLTSFQRLDDLLAHQIALLQERRQALITAAVTGELEIPEVAA